MYKSIQKTVAITIADGATSGNATISSVNVNYTEAEIVGILGTDFNVSYGDGAYACTVLLAGATTVTAYRGVAASKGVTVYVNVIEYNPLFVKSVQCALITLTSGIHVGTAGISAIVTGNSRVKQCGYTTNFLDNVNPIYSAFGGSYFNIDSTTQISLNRASSDGVAVISSVFYVIEMRF